MAGRGRLWERRVLALGALALALLVLGAGYRLFRDSIGRICNDFLYPYLHLERAGASHLAGVFGDDEAAGRIAELQKRNAELSIRLLEAEQALKEYPELRRTANFSPPPEWSTLKAEVIKRDPLMWRERFTVDRGSEDGVVSGAAVVGIDVDAAGRPLLIGVIERVDKRSSTVRTLYSGLRIVAQLGSPRKVGEVNAGALSRDDGLLPIGYLPRVEHYSRSEEAVTTGYERRIPAGLVIGKLVSVEDLEERFSSHPCLSGGLKPAADIDGVRFVVIAVPKGGKAAP